MAKAKKVPRPRIHHLCSLGTLTGHGGKKGEWSVPQKLKRIRKAGFDGFLGRVHMLSREQVDASGLIFACTTDMGGLDEVEEKLSAVKAHGARVCNVQMLNHDTPTDVAVEVARKVMDVAAQIDLDVSIEVHRDTCTETPEKTYALAEGFEQAEGRPLKMTWDFSHPAVTKHLSPPYWDRLAVRPDLMQLANQYHFRPFNGHHAQVPALNAKGKVTPEFVDFMEFVDRVLETWLAVAEPGREMFACPEQIAGGYMLSVFGDRFKDVQEIRRQIDKSFKKHLRTWKKAHA